jgi:uncharacterized protein YbjQ (UPF0145 family)
MLITTTPGIEGRPVTEYLGIVTAQGVLGVNAFKDVSAGMRNIFGGRAKSYENELASGVSDALAEMEKQAAKLGADAVVGVDVDYESVGSNMLMVSASGTAVKLGRPECRAAISPVRVGRRAGSHPRQCSSGLTGALSSASRAGRLSPRWAAGPSHPAWSRQTRYRRRLTAANMLPRSQPSPSQPQIDGTARAGQLTPGPGLRKPGPRDCRGIPPHSGIPGSVPGSGGPGNKALLRPRRARRHGARPRPGSRGCRRRTGPTAPRCRPR